MKKTFLKSLAGIAAVAFAVSCTAPAPKYKTVVVDAPFAMEPIKECVFPEQDFSMGTRSAGNGLRRCTSIHGRISRTRRLRNGSAISIAVARFCCL